MYILNKVQPLDYTVKLEYIINKEATTSFGSSLSLLKEYVYLILDTQFLINPESKLLESAVYAKNSKLIYELINIKDKLTTLNEYVESFIKARLTFNTLPSLNDILIENFKQDIFEIESASKELIDLIDTLNAIKCTEDVLPIDLAFITNFLKVLKQLDTLTNTYFNLKSSQKINIVTLGRLYGQFTKEIPILERACRTFNNEIFIKISTFDRELRKIKSSVADQQYTINEIKLDLIRKSN